MQSNTWNLTNLAPPKINYELQYKIGLNLKSETVAFLFKTKATSGFLESDLNRSQKNIADPQKAEPPTPRLPLLFRSKWVVFQGTPETQSSLPNGGSAMKLGCVDDVHFDQIAQILHQLVFVAPWRKVRRVLPLTLHIMARTSWAVHSSSPTPPRRISRTTEVRRTPVGSYKHAHQKFVCQRRNSTGRKSRMSGIFWRPDSGSQNRSVRGNLNMFWEFVRHVQKMMQPFPVTFAPLDASQSLRASVLHPNLHGCIRGAGQNTRTNMFSTSLVNTRPVPVCQPHEKHPASPRL